MNRRLILGGEVIALCLLVLSASGVVTAAGTTEVMISPENDTIAPGETVSYDVVVEDASGGVGSFNVTFSTNDTAVAKVQNVTYADTPDYSHRASGSNDVRLAATGMETLDDGPVRVATVTVKAAETGDVRFSLSVDALGDEDGKAYTVAGTQGRTLSVENQATPTPSPTPTSTPTATADEESTGNDDSSDSATVIEDGGGTETPGLDGTDSPIQTTTVAPTTTSLPTDTQTSPAGGAVTPTETRTSSSVPIGVILAGVFVLLTVVGLYTRFR